MNWRNQLTAKWTPGPLLTIIEEADQPSSTRLSQTPTRTLQVHCSKYELRKRTVCTGSKMYAGRCRERASWPSSLFEPCLAFTDTVVQSLTLTLTLTVSNTGREQADQAHWNWSSASLSGSPLRTQVVHPILQSLESCLHPQSNVENSNWPDQCLAICNAMPNQIPNRWMNSKCGAHNLGTNAVAENPTCIHSWSLILYG